MSCFSYPMGIKNIGLVTTSPLAAPQETQRNLDVYFEFKQLAVGMSTQFNKLAVGGTAYIYVYWWTKPSFALQPSELASCSSQLYCKISASHLAHHNTLQEIWQPFHLVSHKSLFTAVWPYLLLHIHAFIIYFLLCLSCISGRRYLYNKLKADLSLAYLYCSFWLAWTQTIDADHKMMMSLCCLCFLPWREVHRNHHLLRSPYIHQNYQGLAVLMKS